MKIITRNETRIIAVHDGMPFMFSRKILEHLEVASIITAQLDSQTEVGVYIDKDFQMHKVIKDSQYFKLIMERLK